MLRVRSPAGVRTIHAVVLLVMLAVCAFPRSAGARPDPLRFVTPDRRFDPDAWFRAGGRGPLSLPEDVRFDPGCLTPLGLGRPAAPGDENWYPGFGEGVLDGAVRAIVPFGDGHAIGGDFLMEGSNPLNSVALVSGGAILPLGGGVDGRVRALTVHDGQLVAGGEFQSADGEPASFVARWNGNEWQALGPGLDGHVHALHSHGGLLWAGGAFTGTSPPWDGAVSSSPGGTAENWVRTFATHEGSLRGG